MARRSRVAEGVAQMITPKVSIQRRNMDKNTSGSRALSVSSKLISNLYELYMNNQIIVNRRYQRKLVWTLEEKQKLIQSILDSYPIPAVILNKINNGTYEVIDGLQRLNAVMAFAEQEFPTLDGEYFEIEQMQYAKLRSIEGIFEAKDKETEKIMSLQSASKFPTYAMSVLEISNATEEEIDEIFRRINTYGHQLSNQERRQAGVQGKFSEFVRDVSNVIRIEGESLQSLPLNDMPSISIGGSKNTDTAIAPENIFWIKHGILSQNDLRASQDEECIATIIAAVIRDGQMVPRRRGDIDKLYEPPELNELDEKLGYYGEDKLKDEIEFCVNEINKVVDFSKRKSLSQLVSPSSSNAYPSKFVSIFVALHTTLFGRGTDRPHKITDYRGIVDALRDIGNNKNTTSKSEKNLKIEVQDYITRFAPHTSNVGDVSEIYKLDSVEIDKILKKSPMEDTSIDYKQGLFPINVKPSTSELPVANVKKILQTACAIANCGHKESGYVVLGIAESKDVEKIEETYGIKAKKAYGKNIVGVNREIDSMGLSLDKEKGSSEEYVDLWRNAIRNSPLSEKLKKSLLQKIRYYDYKGYGILSLEIEPQSEMSLYDGVIYVREGSSNAEYPFSSENLNAISNIASRFS